MSIARDVLLALGAMLVVGALSAAERYPVRPVRLVLSFGSGGGDDAAGRIIASKFSAALGQRVAVETKGGAAGIDGTLAVIKSEPNGYTLLLGRTDSLAMTPHLYPAAGYDPRRDLAPVGLIGRVPLLMVVHQQAPMKAAKHFIDLARIAPGKLNYGSGGAGSDSHLVGELFAYASGIKVTHLPYRDTAQAVAGLLSREVDVVFSVLPPVRGYIETGTLRALAFTSPDRVPVLPGVPTTAEAGLAGFEAVLIYGLAGPAGMPPTVIDRLNKRLNALLQADDVRQLFVKDGITPLSGAPGTYATVIAADYEKWGEVVRRSGARIE